MANPPARKPGPSCSVCAHPKQHMIDLALADRRNTFVYISTEFDASAEALRRHVRKEDCTFRRGIERAKNLDEWAELEAALNIAYQLKYVNEAVRDELESAREKDDPRLVLQASDRVLAQLRFQAERAGEVGSSRATQINQQFNLYQSPQWIEVRTAIVAALEEIPAQYREVVLQALEKAREKPHLQEIGERNGSS